MVAGLDARYPGTHRFDDARSLVAEHRRRLPRDRAVDHGKVGVADARRLDGDEHLAAARILHRELVGDLGIAAGENDASHLPIYLLSEPVAAAPVSSSRASFLSSVLSTLPLALSGRASTILTLRGTL